MQYKVCFFLVIGAYFASSCCAHILDILEAALMAAILPQILSLVFHQLSSFLWPLLITTLKLIPAIAIYRRQLSPGFNDISHYHILPRSGPQRLSFRSCICEER